MPGEKGFIVRYLSATLAGEEAKRVALVLACLDEETATAVFEVLPSEAQGRISKHLATADFDPDLPDDIREMLQESWRDRYGDADLNEEWPAPRGPETDAHTIPDLRRRWRAMAEDVENRIFAFDDMVRLSDREIRHVLERTSVRDLAIALTGARTETRQRIFANLTDDVASSILARMARDQVPHPDLVAQIQHDIVLTIHETQPDRPGVRDRADSDLPR